MIKHTLVVSLSNHELQARPSTGSGRAEIHMLRASAALFPVLALAALQPISPPDTILVNGHVITVDSSFSIAEAIAIANGKFTAVGTNAAVGALAGSSTTVVDLHGLTVIPGLADGHLHDAGGGPGVDLSRARSIADVLTAVRARVAQSRPGDVLV